MKKIDRQKLCELFSRLDHLCNSVSIFKDTRVSYCDKKFKSFIEEKESNGKTNLHSRYLVWDC